MTLHCGTIDDRNVIALGGPQGVICGDNIVKALHMALVDRYNGMDRSVLMDMDVAKMLHDVGYLSQFDGLSFLDGGNAKPVRLRLQVDYKRVAKLINYQCDESLDVLRLAMQLENEAVKYRYGGPRCVKCQTKHWEYRLRLEDPRVELLAGKWLVRSGLCLSVVNLMVKFVQGGLSAMSKWNHACACVYCVNCQVQKDIIGDILCQNGIQAHWYDDVNKEV